MAKSSKLRPSTRDDVADDNPTVLARRVHALNRDLRDFMERFDLFAQRVLDELDGVRSRGTDQAARFNRLESRVDRLEAITRKDEGHGTNGV